MQARKSSRRLPSPALLVAVIALVAALSGSAIALKGKNKVKSDDIAPHAVKGKDIAAEAIKPHMLDLIKVDGAVGPLITTAVPATDLGGPSVTVNVPTTGLVAIYARATGQINGGGQGALAQVHLFEPTLLPLAPRVLEFSGPRRSFGSRPPAPGTSTAPRC